MGVAKPCSQVWSWKHSRETCPSVNSGTELQTPTHLVSNKGILNKLDGKHK